MPAGMAVTAVTTFFSPVAIVYQAGETGRAKEQQDPGGPADVNRRVHLQKVKAALLIMHSLCLHSLFFAC